MAEQHVSYEDAFDGGERVVIAIGDVAGLAAIRDAAAGRGTRIAAQVSLQEAPQRLAMQARLHAIAIDVPDDVPDPTMFAAVDAVVDAARRHDARVIATCRLPMLDRMAAGLNGANVDLLCDPTAAQHVAAMALALPGAVMLNDAARESEHQRLRQLNDEVARIAETLARLARDDSPTLPPAVVADRSPVFRGGPDAPEMEIEPAEVRATIRARRLRDQFFDSGLFADPAWDMLLDLFAAQLEHARVSVSSLCIAAAVPPTTALRWITTMREAGLFERHDDPFDRRRAYVGLSETARLAMQRYCAALKRAGLALP